MNSDSRVLRSINRHNARLFGFVSFATRAAARRGPEASLCRRLFTDGDLALMLEEHMRGVTSYEVQLTGFADFSSAFPGVKSNNAARNMEGIQEESEKLIRSRLARLAKRSGVSISGIHGRVATGDGGLYSAMFTISWA